ncbi:MAG: prepilin-type N-terminal cleavage/methylation domain-containing protein [Candidatus Moraniibacteriota bacterium]
MKRNYPLSTNGFRRKLIAGMTLVELIVSIFIMTVGMAGFSMLFLRSWNMNRFILETGVASAAASRGVDKLVSDLRKIRQGDDGSYPMVLGNGLELTAFLDIDNDGTTERIHYFLQNGSLKRGVAKPDTTHQPVSYPSGETVTTIANFVVNTVDKPIFYYYNDNYPGDTVNNPLHTPVAVQDVRLVKVRLIVNINPNRAPEETTIESFAEFRNLNP